MGTPPVTPAPYTMGPPQQKKNRRTMVIVAWILGVFVLGLCAFIVGLTMFVFGMMKGSEPYKQALAAAQSSPKVQQRLGTPIKPGWYVLGNINLRNDDGEANLQFPINGPKGSGSIFVEATKTAGQWSFQRLSVGSDGAPDIDLLAPTVKDQ